ncbi:MAG TPA: immune inhibitor A, partial [Lentimicrobium sp.]|nr:immune inhibitor A [Lentimicrobium sp.]
NNANSSITLTSDISLQNASLAMLSFYARWRIEQGYDYVQVKISTNNGSTWTPLSGKYTKTGNYNQAAGQPLYDGIMNQWVHEEINISEFAGRDIKLRFTLRTDGNTVDDGFLFDDLSVSILDITTGMHSPNTQTLPFISELWPNPSANKIKLTYTLPDFNGKAAVVITDLSGRVVLSMPVDEKKGELEFDASSLSPGLYFCNLVAGTRSLATKKFVKQ